jgi:hypothetical protein
MPSWSSITWTVSWSVTWIAVSGSSLSSRTLVDMDAGVIGAAGKAVVEPPSL